MDYDASSGRRNKGKDKKKNNKKHPYRKGGKYRATEVKA
jgi:hypothetical protein